MAKEIIKVGDAVVPFPHSVKEPEDLKGQEIIVVTEIKDRFFTGISLTSMPSPRLVCYCELDKYFKVSMSIVQRYLNAVIEQHQNQEDTLKINPGDLVRKRNMGDADALVEVIRVYPARTKPSFDVPVEYLFDGIVIAGVDTPRPIEGASFDKFSVVPAEDRADILRLYNIKLSRPFIPKDGDMCWSTKYFNEFKAKTEAELRRIHRIMADTRLPGMDVERMLEVLDGVDVGDFQWTTRQGRTVAIKHMTDEHIHNAINYLKRRDTCSVCCPEGHLRRYTPQFYLELFKRELQRRADKSHEQAKRMSDFLNKE